MRLLDRYVVRQLTPVWVWCLGVFLVLSCLVDLFGNLDEILRYQVPLRVLGTYYANFLPLVFVHACPLALLLSAAFVTMRLSRHQELLAMTASGTSLLRASVPFLFVGWLATLLVFSVNELLLPQSLAALERIKTESLRGDRKDNAIDNVALMDSFNRLYHARTLDLDAGELRDLTVLEQDVENHPMRSLYASRAVWTKFGWLLLYGTIYRVGPAGVLRGEPQPFVERLIAFPVTPSDFAEPEAQPETMRYGQLRILILRLRQMGITNVRRYQVELAAKVSLPIMSLLACLIAFVGSTQLATRGTLRGFGQSLGWGMAYYVAVAVCHAVAKQWAVPVILALWAPHAAAAAWAVRRLTRA
ncbi:MAG TPA: LptF/LptG family permease [bacterium]